MYSALRILLLIRDPNVTVPGYRKAKLTTKERRTKLDHRGHSENTAWRSHNQAFSRRFSLIDADQKPGREFTRMNANLNPDNQERSDENLFRNKGILRIVAMAQRKPRKSVQAADSRMHASLRPMAPRGWCPLFPRSYGLGGLVPSFKPLCYCPFLTS